jgi:hypothetical protein
MQVSVIGKDDPGPRGKLGTMVVGIGAVATTLIAGVEAVRKKIGE